MNISRVAVWAAMPLTIIAFLVSFLIAVAGAGHGDKTPVLFIFPLPVLVWIFGGIVLGVVAAGFQFPLYALAIHVASKRGWEWLAAGGVFLVHFGAAGLVFWLLNSG